ncbi:hypothetical protein CHU98_g10279 [Xylaria longipes]|nr:hypothetical protein CHU98_g10279 [Xylaria longipes]
MANMPDTKNGSGTGEDDDVTSPSAFYNAGAQARSLYTWLKRNIMPDLEFPALNIHEGKSVPVMNAFLTMYYHYELIRLSHYNTFTQLSYILTHGNKLGDKVAHAGLRRKNKIFKDTYDIPFEGRNARRDSRDERIESRAERRRDENESSLEKQVNPQTNNRRRKAQYSAGSTSTRRTRTKASRVLYRPGDTILLVDSSQCRPNLSRPIRFGDPITFTCAVEEDDDGEKEREGEEEEEEAGSSEAASAPQGVCPVNYANLKSHVTKIWPSMRSITDAPALVAEDGMRWSDSEVMSFWKNSNAKFDEEKSKREAEFTPSKTT